MQDSEAAKVTTPSPSKIKTTVTTDEISYDLIFNLQQNKIMIEAYKTEDLFKVKYSKSLTIEDFYGLNRMFKQFEDLGEIFQSIRARDESKDDAFNISVEDNKIKLIIKYLTQRKNEYKEVVILLVREDSKTEDIVPKLCDAVEELNNKITALKKELNIATNNKILELQNELDFVTKNILGLSKEEYEKLKSMPLPVKISLKDINSSIITSPIDLAVIESGIKKNLNKSIQSMKLLFSTDTNNGPSSTFHSSCNGHCNTLTVVRSNNNRRFGGFTSIAWDSSGSYKTDEKAFIFSLDDKNCYYQKENNNGANAIYCNSGYGPAFGNGHDFYLADSCKSNTSSYDNTPYAYDTKGKKFALNLSYYFTVLCYEVYELSFE